jgi:hypothetical protein
MSRSWSVGKFADVDAAGTARDQLRREGIDAFMVCTG